MLFILEKYYYEQIEIDLVFDKNFFKRQLNSD